MGVPMAPIATAALEARPVGTRAAFARVGEDGTAELALYERTTDGWNLVGNGWGDKTSTSTALVEGYEDMMVVHRPEDTPSVELVATTLARRVEWPSLHWRGWHDPEAQHAIAVAVVSAMEAVKQP